VGTARVPHAAWEAIRTGLASGAVLVQVARRGYLRGVVCDECRTVQRCATCAGPLSVAQGGTTSCDWCGALDAKPGCAACGGRRIRASAVGSERTVHELGRAFPGVVVRRSDADAMLDDVPDTPAIIVATPGAEPRAEGGYAAGVILDARAELERPALRGAQEALRRWMYAASLVRPRGPIVITADLALAPVQALLRWDAAWFAERELLERAHLGLPPATRAAAVTGARADVEALVGAAYLPGTARHLGPVPAARGGGERLLVTVARRDGAALARALRAAVVTSSARGAEPVEVRMDPDL
jgi:primosomal protein N' (replication factor Y)